jgi:hypothetical protein
VGVGEKVQTPQKGDRSPGKRQNRSTVMITSEGFVKLYREGLALLELSPSAFVLLTQIALRANRVDPAYSIYKLKINESVIGDHKKIGLSRQQYRDAVLRLEACGLATFRKTNQGTIAVLTNTAIFDINAESDERQIKACTALEKEPNYNHARTIQQPLENQKETTLEPSKEPTDLSMKNREKEPPKEPVNNHQRTIKEPDRNQSGTTNKERKKRRRKKSCSGLFTHCLQMPGWVGFERSGEEIPDVL